MIRNVKITQSNQDFNDLFNNFGYRVLEVDFECEYNRYIYGEFVCLMQIYSHDFMQ